MISDHAVGITMHGSGLKIDVAPVLYTGEPDDRGYLVTRQGDRVLTSVTLHLQFLQSRRDAAGPEYRELIRLLKAWMREAKRIDDQLRCKSFLIELIVAHLWDKGWNGERAGRPRLPASLRAGALVHRHDRVAHADHLHRLLRRERGRGVERSDPGLGPGQPDEQRRPHLHRGCHRQRLVKTRHRHAGGDRLGRAGADQGRRQRCVAQSCSGRDSRGHDVDAPERGPRHSPSPRRATSAPRSAPISGCSMASTAPRPLRWTSTTTSRRSRFCSAMATWAPCRMGSGMPPPTSGSFACGTPRRPAAT